MAGPIIAGERPKLQAAFVVLVVVFFCLSTIKSSGDSDGSEGLLTGCAIYSVFRRGDASLADLLARRLLLDLCPRVLQRQRSVEDQVARRRIPIHAEIPHALKLESLPNRALSE